MIEASFDLSLEQVMEMVRTALDAKGVEAVRIESREERLAGWEEPRFVGFRVIVAVGNGPEGGEGVMRYDLSGSV